MPKTSNEFTNRSSITHKGRIDSVGQDYVTVAIAPSNEECGKCAIASLCSRPTLVEVALPGATPGLIGRQATIGYASSAHRLATLLFIGAPLALLLLVLCAASALGASQLLAGSLAIGAMCAWYLILIGMRSRLRGKARFQILHLWD